MRKRVDVPGKPDIRNRIRELRMIAASELVPAPNNWRVHGPDQRKALKAFLAELGFAGAVIAWQREDGKLVVADGNLRVELLGKQKIPVLITDLSEQEAQKLLLVYDPIASMAQADQERLNALLMSVQFENKDLGPLLERIAGQDGWQAIVEKLPLVDPPAQVDKAAELRAKWGP